VHPLSRAESRAVDARAIEGYGLPGIVLMENAGAGAARLLHALAGGAGRVTVVCGRGNNGGDGFVVARHLENLGHAVRVLLACEPQAFRGDAAVNHAVVARSGLAVTGLAGASAGAWEGELASAGWIVDALLGTGASGPPRGAVALAIDAINATAARGARVLALDLPSGLDCDSGGAPGACVRATHTATFVAPKAGFAAPGAAAFTGAVHVIDIGVPHRLLEELAVDRPLP
jgi:NAD(P)H-hydrate epimerase